MEHIFSIWPSLTELSKDIGAQYPTVAAWKQRGSIPAAYDLDLIAAARRRGVTLTLEDLAHARRPRRSRQVQAGAA